MNTAVSQAKMSTPRDLVCDFRLAKRIKELGVELTTFFYYLYFPNTGKYFIYRNKTAFKTYDFNVAREVECDLIPAPLSEELIAVMPEMHRTWWKSNSRNRNQKMWYCSNNDLNEINIIVKTAVKESSARAKMLIYLLEQRLINIPHSGDGLS